MSYKKNAHTRRSSNMLFDVDISILINFKVPLEKVTILTTHINRG